MNDPRLLIPLADLPGLDLAGLRCTTPDPITDAAAPSIALGPDTRPEDQRHGPWLVYQLDCVDDDMSVVSALVDEIILDLSDPATRDRCLRWLAKRVGLAVGCGAPRWYGYRESGRVAWLLGHGRGWLYGDMDGPACTRVAALASLDPTADDTRLPDGSRLVDALALAAVLRQVGCAP